MSASAGFGWGRVDFHHSSWSGAVFGFVLSTGLITRGCFVVAESSGSASRPFLLLTATQRGLGGAQGDGGDTAGRADPSLPQGYPTPYGSRSWGEGGGKGMEFVFPKVTFDVMEPSFPGDG